MDIFNENVFFCLQFCSYSVVHPAFIIKRVVQTHSMALQACFGKSCHHYVFDFDSSTTCIFDH